MTAAPDQLRAQLDRARGRLSLSITGGLTLAIALRVLRPDDASPYVLWAAAALAVPLLLWQAVTWQRIVQLRRQLGLDWRGRPQQ